MIRLLLVENNRLFSEGIQALIKQEKDINVLANAVDDHEAIEMANSLKPDVILMEMVAPGIDGISIAKRLKELEVHSKVVYLIGPTQKHFIIEAVEVGASGFLSKAMEAEQLYRSIRDAKNGHYVLSGDIAEVVVRYMKGMAPDEQYIIGRSLRQNGIELKQKELNIAMLLFKGNSNQEISDITGLSMGTVKNYVSFIYHRIGVKNRNGAIHFYNKLMADNK